MLIILENGQEAVNRLEILTGNSEEQINSIIKFCKMDISIFKSLNVAEKYTLANEIIEHSRLKYQIFDSEGNKKKLIEISV